MKGDSLLPTEIAPINSFLLFLQALLKVLYVAREASDRGLESVNVLGEEFVRGLVFA
jgi:hypothetical protein